MPAIMLAHFTIVSTLFLFIYDMIPVRSKIIFYVITSIQRFPRLTGTEPLRCKLAQCARSMTTLYGFTLHHENVGDTMRLNKQTSGCKIKQIFSAHACKKSFTLPLCGRYVGLQK